jgi:tRNA pseudouridine32 synthase / 23S rRNA pseudouridine746 synthase
MNIDRLFLNTNYLRLETAYPREQILNSAPTYWYTGSCPHSGEQLRLPRTELVEQIARDLMAELAQDDRYTREGKMYGVLLVEANPGEYYSIKAFSGLLNSEAVVAGWVPRIPGRDRVATQEAATIADLAAMKQALIDLDRSTEREQYRSISAEYVNKIKQLSIAHKQRKLDRQQQRELAESTLSGGELTDTLDRLIAQSCQDGRERDRLRQERDGLLQPLQRILDQADDRIRELKQQRKIISRQLQEQMHQAYRLMNFLGTSSSLRELMPGGIPTGTGDCCAPKLMHYAASHGLRPIAMAEFWWGDEGMGGQGDGVMGRKIQGEFYGACLERCQPLMGFMLAGVVAQPAKLDLVILYEDEYLVAIDKPSGLLSVPGRSIDLQDSVLTRLRSVYPEIHSVHRLDRDTSGVLVFARDQLTYRQLSQQFEARQVTKIYEAILGGMIEREQGSIDLPLWGDPLDRPRQQVNFDLGKPSVSEFTVLDQIDGYTRIEFRPVTGRTHQLRAHAADSQGLGVPILGDRLYGCLANVVDKASPLENRLYLHARELVFTHPHNLKRIQIQIPCPF